MNEVIGSLIATRVLIQYLPQTVGFFLLRFRAPDYAAALQDVVLSRSRNNLDVRVGLRAGDVKSGSTALRIRRLRCGNRHLHGQSQNAEGMAVPS